jgi:hypothetical protein
MSLNASRGQREAAAAVAAATADGSLYAADEGYDDDSGEHQPNESGPAKSRWASFLGEEPPPAARLDDDNAEVCVSARVCVRACVVYGGGVGSHPSH